MPNNRCCTYPHGEGLILPQALMMMAIFANMMMFNPTNILDTGGYDFFCLEYFVYAIGTDITDSDPEVSCYTLTMFSTSYWRDLTEQQTGYHSALQAAAVIGAMATIVGTLTLVIIIRTICFETRKSSIIVVIIFQGVASLLSLLTLIAGSMDICKLALGDQDEDSTIVCDVNKVRIMPGAGFAIFAGVLYILALVFTVIFLIRPSSWSKEENLVQNSDEETAGLIKTGDSSKEGTYVKRFPDGSKQIERRFVDSNGNVVTETTFEESVKK